MRVAYTREGHRIELDGERLRAIRQSRGMTLDEVGAACGRTAAAICSLEHERWLPSLDTCDALKALFGKDLMRIGALRVVGGWIAEEEKHLDKLHRQRMRDGK